MEARIFTLRIGSADYHRELSFIRAVLIERNQKISGHVPIGSQNPPAYVEVKVSVKPKSGIGISENDLGTSGHLDVAVDGIPRRAQRDGGTDTVHLIAAEIYKLV